MATAFSLKRPIAELLGAFFLTFAVLAAPGMITAALTLGTVVYLVGSVSGAHINPAITVGLLSIGKIKAKDAVMYIVAQIIGALLAAFAITNMIEIGAVDAVDGAMVVVAEFMGTFVLALGVGAVVFGRVHEAATGAVVGLSLLLGALLAVGSLGILNPAVAIGAGVTALSYLLSPLVGGVVGMQMARWIFGKK